MQLALRRMHDAFGREDWPIFPFPALLQFHKKLKSLLLLISPIKFRVALLIGAPLLLSFFTRRSVHYCLFRLISDLGSPLLGLLNMHRPVPVSVHRCTKC